MNYNRLNESLKLIEDFIRFSIENKTLLAVIRSIRTSFHAVKKRIPVSTVIKARASRSDLGRTPAFDRHKKRSRRNILIANITRAKESSRILEEIFRCDDVQTSRYMKEIRYKLYDLERDIHVLQTRDFDCSLYAIYDEIYIKPSRLERDVRTMIRYGVTALQLRVKTLSDRVFLRYANKIAQLLKGSKITFIINNRIDIAIACQANGVHLGQQDVSVRVARRVLGDHYIVGVSVRTATQARRAEPGGADYLGAGAVFPSATKNDTRVIGLEGMRVICKTVGLPVVGIGGITAKNYKSVIKTGASGIAVSSYLFKGSLGKNIRSLTGKRQ